MEGLKILGVHRGWGGVEWGDGGGHTHNILTL